MSDTLPLGQPITFTHSLHRRFHPSAPYSRKRWDVKPVLCLPFTGPRLGVERLDGIVVGIRTLANGELLPGGWEDPDTFRPTEYFTAYLVAYDVRRKPVYVLPEHITQEGTA